MRIISVVWKKVETMTVRMIPEICTHSLLYFRPSTTMNLKIASAKYVQIPKVKMTWNLL